MSISTKQLPTTAYLFDLHLMCGGYAYYSTFTAWSSFGEHDREYRQPDLVKAHRAAESCEMLGQEWIFISDQSKYDFWLSFRGWALVPQDVARSIMPQWLKKRLCLKTPANTFVDLEICSPHATDRFASKGKRKTIINRDGEQCLLCKKTIEDGISLTMQHIRPYSKAGETTSRNLVTLCEECNQSLGDNHCSYLYGLAELPHGLDLGLFRELPTNESIDRAKDLSDNLMHTRCEVW